jgi:ATP phosphoribosyltransferase regulatory subunit HisZ
MKAITLRNLPAEVDKAIRTRARRARVSVNKAVIGLLEEYVTRGKQKEQERHYDLDHLCGSWTDAEADAFDRALDKQRTIDPDVWK